MSYPIIKKCYVLLGLLSWPLFAQMVFYGPHLTATSPWVNKIFVFNSGSIPAEFQMLTYDSSGNLVSDESYGVDGLDVLTLVLTNYTSYMPSSTEIKVEAVNGSFTIETSSADLTPLLSFRYGDSPALSQFFLNKTTGRQYVLPNLSASTFDWTGFALMNASEQAKNVSFKAFRDGLQVAQSQLELEAHSHWVGTSEMVWAGLGVADFDQVTIESDLDIPAPIQITGNDNQDRHLFFMGFPVQVELAY